ncbi:MAG: hypothetical protein KBC02_03550 [Candidatus Pacebacteria bacterium]|nr:hypothetical protein [Candidatus Paceibacterota bacterium]
MKIRVSSEWSVEERRGVIRAIQSHCDELMRESGKRIDDSPEASERHDVISAEIYALCELMEFVEHESAEILERFRYRVEAYVVDPSQ